MMAETCQLCIPFTYLLVLFKYRGIQIQNLEIELIRYSIVLCFPSPHVDSFWAGGG